MHSFLLAVGILLLLGIKAQMVPDYRWPRPLTALWFSVHKGRWYGWAPRWTWRFNWAFRLGYRRSVIFRLSLGLSRVNFLYHHSRLGDTEMGISFFCRGGKFRLIPYFICEPARDFIREVL